MSLIVIRKGVSLETYEFPISRSRVIAVRYKGFQDHFKMSRREIDLFESDDSYVRHIQERVDIISKNLIDKHEREAGVIGKHKDKIMLIGIAAWAIAGVIVINYLLFKLGFPL